MSYAISWLGDEQILYCRLWGSLLVPELRAANAATDALLVKASPPVHLVFHVTEMDHRLPSISAMRGPLTTRGHDRIGWTLFVGGSAAVRFIGLVVARSLGLRVHSTATMDEAADFLAVTDPELGWPVLHDLKRLSSCAPDRLPVEPVLPRS